MEVAQATRALGRDKIGQDLIQRRVDCIGHEVTHDVPQRHGCRVHGVDNCILGRGDPERLQRGGVVGNLRRDGAFQRVAGIGLGIDQRAVDALFVDPAGAREIRQDVIFFDAHRDLQRDRRVEAVDRHLAGRLLAWQRRDPLQRGAAGIVEDETRDAGEIVEGKLLHHVDQPAVADLVAGGERVDVADQLIRLAHVATDDPHQCRVDLARIGEFHDRQVKPFFVDARRIRTKATPADVDDMRGTGKEADQLATVKRRRDHGDVMQMARPLPRVVGDINVALKDVLPPDAADKMRHRVGHGVDVAGRAGDRLRQHLTVGIIDPGREIARLAHRGRKGGAHQRLRLFLNDRDQPVPHDLIGDVGMCLCHGLTLSR